MPNQLTPNLSLPLPHPDNELEDDVARIRDAITGLDTVVGSLLALVASDDLNFDTVQEIVTVLKDAQDDIGDITAILATKATNQALTDEATARGQGDTNEAQARTNADNALQANIDQQIATVTQSINDLATKLRTAAEIYFMKG